VDVVGKYNVPFVVRLPLLTDSGNGKLIVSCFKVLIIDRCLL